LWPTFKRFCHQIKPDEVFGTHSLPQRAPASDKTLDDEKVPGASFIVNGAAPAKDEMKLVK
jgi:hypothetical protein